MINLAASNPDIQYRHFSLDRNLSKGLGCNLGMDAMGGLVESEAVGANRNMNKSETYQYLTEQNITYEVTEHKAVFNMEELDSVNLPYPEWDAKNLFVRDDKKRNYYLITVKGNKRVDLKEFRKQHGLRALSFAAAEDLFAIMRLQPGSVTPLGILNDAEHRVHFYLDSEFVGNKIGVHPNDNTATVWMQADDLMKLIQKHGNEALFVKI